MRLDYSFIGTHVNESKTLPKTMYTDPAVFELEKESIFRKEWLAVARFDQIPNAGDYITHDLFGDPIVVVRDRDRSVKAFSSVCLHRGCPIVEGKGSVEGGLFVCPYHRWTYALNGKLKGTPYFDQAQDFDTSTWRLPQLAVEEYQGWIFVNANKNAEPLAPRLEQLTERIAPWNFSELRLVDTLTFDSNWNWKIMIENFMESYHHMGAHRETLHPIFPAEGTYAEQVEGDFLLLENPTVLENHSRFWAGCILPFTMFALTRSEQTNGSWYQMHIDSYDHFRLDIHLLMREQEAASPEAVQGFVDSMNVIHNEDIPVCEGVWTGVNSTMHTQGRLSHLEACNWNFYDYLRGKMGQ